MFDKLLEEPINEVVPSGLTHIGFIAGSIDGTFATLCPIKNLSGGTSTFPKERVIAGELPAETLRRCLAKCGKEPAYSLYPVPLVAVTPNSTSFFFTGFLPAPSQGWKAEYGAFEWNAPERIISELGASKDAVSRRRDLAVFNYASQMCLSPDRRIMLMLRELHKMGFERLRAPSHAWNVSWRCFIVPAAWTYKKHGAKFRDPRTRLAPLPALRTSDSVDFRYMYAGAQRQQPFGWTGVPFANPKELADRFLRECPDIAMPGWGPDGDYVAWYERLLEATKPYHEFNSEGDSYGSTEHIFITMGKHFPLPPPGQMD